MFSRHAASAVPPGFRSDLLRWRQLVDADWLATLLRQAADPQAKHAPLAAAPARWLLLEVGCEGDGAYLGGHIPGARFLDTREMEQAPFWNSLPDAALLYLLQQRLGLGLHSTVILYARNTLAAARVAHLLLYAGVQDVRLLDGGLAAWCAAGHALEQGRARGLGSAQEREPAVGCAAAQEGAWLAWRAGVPAQADYLLNLHQTRALLQQPITTLVSIRSRAEFMGETSGYSYIAARGEIPGALWGHAGRDGDVNSMNSFQQADGRMKSATEIAAVWAAAGIGPEQHVVFYCGTGWRASLAFFYAWLMGWPRISVFDGGWMEWSADTANPVVCRSAPGVPEPGTALANA